jgi:hypothetical protein
MVNSNNPSWLLLCMPALSKAPAIVAEILKHRTNNILFSAVNYAPLTASLLMRAQVPAPHLFMDYNNPV